MFSRVGTSSALLAGTLGLLGSGLAVAQEEHDPKHLSAVEILCITVHDDETFCGCVREAVETHLPPDHASFEHEAFISDDVPDDVAETVDNAVLACRDTHVEFEEGDLDDETPG